MLLFAQYSQLVIITIDIIKLRFGWTQLCWNNVGDILTCSRLQSQKVLSLQHAQVVRECDHRQPNRASTDK